MGINRAKDETAGQLRNIPTGTEKAHADCTKGGKGTERKVQRIDAGKWMKEMLSRGNLNEV